MENTRFPIRKPQFTGSDGADSTAAFFVGVSCQSKTGTDVSCQEGRNGI